MHFFAATKPCTYLLKRSYCEPKHDFSDLLFAYETLPSGCLTAGNINFKNLKKLPAKIARASL